MIDLRIEFSSFESTYDRLRALRVAMRAGDLDTIHRIVAGGLLGDDAITLTRGARMVAVQGRLRGYLITSECRLYRQKFVSHEELLALGFIETIRWDIPSASDLFLQAGADFTNPRLRRRLLEAVWIHPEKFPMWVTRLRNMIDAGIFVLEKTDFAKINPLEAAALKYFLGLAGAPSAPPR